MTDDPLTEFAREHGLDEDGRIPAPVEHAPTLESVQQADDDLIVYHPERAGEGRWVQADVGVEIRQ